MIERSMKIIAVSQKYESNFQTCVNKHLAYLTSFPFSFRHIANLFFGLHPSIEDRNAYKLLHQNILNIIIPEN